MAGEGGEFALCIQGTQETFGPIKDQDGVRRGEGVTITSDGKCVPPDLSAFISASGLSPVPAVYRYCQYLVASIVGT